MCTCTQCFHFESLRINCRQKCIYFSSNYWINKTVVQRCVFADFTILSIFPFDIALQSNRKAPSIVSALPRLSYQAKRVDYLGSLFKFWTITAFISPSLFWLNFLHFAQKRLRQASLKSRLQCKKKLFSEKLEKRNWPYGPKYVLDHKFI